MISAPSSSRAPWVRALTEACVPTGMKKGVSTVPWGGVVRRPQRAPVGSVFATAKEKFTHSVYQEKTHPMVTPSNVKKTKTPTTMPADLDMGSFFGSMQ